MHSVKQFILGPGNEFLAVSRGIENVDLTEIVHWSAGRGDLLSSGPMAHSWNFHLLPSGMYCLSRTNPLSLLSMREDPEQVFTHGLLVPSGLLKDYANHPVSLIRHLEKQGFWRAGIEVARLLLEQKTPSAGNVESGAEKNGSTEKNCGEYPEQEHSGISEDICRNESVPRCFENRKSTDECVLGNFHTAGGPEEDPLACGRCMEMPASFSMDLDDVENDEEELVRIPENIPILRTLTMDGGSEPVRMETLNGVARTTGIRRFSTILDQILGNFTTILTGRAVPEMLLEALLDVLPVECRLEFSFSTGLRFSENRLFRIVFIGDAVDEYEKVRQNFHLPMISSSSISLMQDLLLPALRNRWAMFIATLFEQNMENLWAEIAILDETSEISELSRRARFWFRKLGLESIYQKIRETRKQVSQNSSGIYEILQTRVSSPEAARNIVASLLGAAEQKNAERFVNEISAERAGSPVPWGTDPKLFQNASFARAESAVSGKSDPGRELDVPQNAVNYYLATLSEAMHGNPLAQGHMKRVFREITEAFPEKMQEEASEILLREGMRSWNEAHGAAQNRSWRQVEEMVDTLSMMLNLVETETLKSEEEI